MKLFSLLLVLLSSRIAHAAMEEPLRYMRGWNVGVSEETAFRVKTAKVLVADYGLIRRDFSSTQGMNNAQIDQWLLKHMAYLSAKQVEKNPVTSQVEIEPNDSKEVYRPRGYGRAWMGEVDGGMIDMKGAGAVNPRRGHHANGLATTGECLREFLFEKMTEKALRAAKSDVSTVGTYAVFDYGFDVIHDDGSRSPAGTILRQADMRAPQQVSSVDPQRAAEMEALLRRFGITTAGDMRKPAYEAVNLQAGKSGNLIDFGAYLVVDKFEKPAAAYDQKFLDPLARTSAEDQLKVTALLHPETTFFPQPDPAIRAPLDQWGNTGKVDPKADRMWGRAHELADAFRHGHMTAEQVRNEVNGYLSRLDDIFRHARPAPKFRWTSFVERLKKGAGTVIAVSDVEELFVRLQRPGFVLERDLEDLGKLVDDTQSFSGAGLVDEVIGRQVAGPGIPWEKFEGYRKSPSASIRKFGFDWLGESIKNSFPEKMQAERVSWVTRWVKEAMHEPNKFEQSTFAKIVNHAPAVREAVMAEMSRPETMEKLRVALRGEEAMHWLRIIETLRPDAKDESLLRLVASQLDGGWRSEAIEILGKADFIPSSMIPELTQAAERLQHSEKNALLEKLQESPARGQGCAASFARIN